MTTNISHIRKEIKNLFDAIEGMYQGYERRPATLDGQSVPTFYITLGEIRTLENQSFGQSQKNIDFKVRLVYDLSPRDGNDVNALDDVIIKALEKVENRNERLGGTVEFIIPNSIESDGELVEEIGGRFMLVYTIKFTVQTRDNAR